MGMACFPVAAVMLLAGCAAVPAPASPSATPPSPTSTLSPASSEPLASATPTLRPALTGSTLAELVDGPAMLAHLEELQHIADDFGGNRARDSQAFQASVTYLHRELLSAHYYVDHQEFSIEGTSGINLIVERGGATEDVIMLGAHLDSVTAGPGINDNGSGVAALLVIAEKLRELPLPDVTIRFAFWDAEEDGPFGSAAYLDSLDPDERARIRAYLNFDMLASPNAIRFVYDEADAAAGSSQLTELFAAHFEDAGLPWEPIDLEGDSDHGPFTAAGIPTGGLFSGGIEPVTDAQAATFGATAGEPADPCSHRACDTLDNIDLPTLEEMADAIASVLASLATDPS